MAPARPREPSIERTEEYHEFIKKLAEYHEKRGTHLDPEPKVGPRHLDLLRLYKRVCEEGGYDRVSDTKNNKLAWRRIASEFLPGSSNVATQAFIVKSAYYKNLAAYEITCFHHRDPPPKEILEDVSAKGGDLLNRTIENFHRPHSREAEALANGFDRDSDGSDHEMDTTPKEEKMDVDEPGSSGVGRITRALRHAPPQRILFQPEVTIRQTRSTTHANSPAPNSSNAMNGTYGTNGAASTIANYEPRQLVASAVKPVTTPSNNPDYYRNLRSRLVQRGSRPPPQNKGMMLPGTGYPGPNIYIRALFALQSGIVEEEEYALHHLVKISHERGDKYRFDGFQGLAEALIAKVLEVTPLFYDMKWDISYGVDSGLPEETALDALNGTPDLLDKIHSMRPLNVEDELQTEEFSLALGRVNEAGLTIRNMVMLEENAQYLSQLPLIRDTITIILNLPHRSTVVELQHYALEIAEQLTKYWSVDAQDPLYRSLLSQLNTTDRGAIITSLRALGRIAMSLEISNRLENVPVPILQRICDWLMVEDEELRNACLDFLYQYTAVLDNVEALLHSVDVEGLVHQLVRLLLYNAKVTDVFPFKPRAAERPLEIPDTAPRLSLPNAQQLAILDEPERSSQWLRTCYEEDREGEVTQIALWSAYNQAFAEVIKASQNMKPLMPAKDFITNVSATFTTASAQVRSVNGQQKYTITGLRPRRCPVDVRGNPYLRCSWRTGPLQAVSNQQNECGEYAQQPSQMWEHIASTHLLIPRDPETGKFNPPLRPNSSVDAPMIKDESSPGPTPNRLFDCRWGDCRHFAATSGSPDAVLVAKHIQTHLPDLSHNSATRLKHNRAHSPSTQFIPDGIEYPREPWRWMNTQIDERSDAAGLPLASVLVLRNLARLLSKVDDGNAQGNGRSDGGWVRRLFGPVKEQLFQVMAYNYSLRDYITSLTMAISTAEGER